MELPIYNSSNMIWWLWFVFKSSSMLSTRYESLIDLSLFPILTLRTFGSGLTCILKGAQIWRPSSYRVAAVIIRAFFVTNNQIEILKCLQSPSWLYWTKNLWRIIIMFSLRNSWELMTCQHGFQRLVLRKGPCFRRAGAWLAWGMSELEP